VKAISTLHDSTGAFINKSENHPSLNSQADREIRTFPIAESVITGYCQGGTLIEVAADQLMAFVKTVTEPAQTIAPWTCVRAVIESCALACWLLSPSIDVKTRVQISLAIRYEGLSQQVKYVQALGDKTIIAKVMARIDEVESKAESLGFSKLVDSTGKRIGIGKPMPSVTELVRKELNEEAFYRLASAMAHGHNWAVQQLSFKQVNNENFKYLENTDSGVVVHTFEKNLDPTVVAFLCYKTALNFVRPLWYECLLFGWNQIELGNLLDAVFNSLGIREDDRCWKSKKSI
jgi:hypothetical protein